MCSRELAGSCRLLHLYWLDSGLFHFPWTPLSCSKWEWWGRFAWSLWYFFKHDAVVMFPWGTRQPFPVNQRLSVSCCFPRTLFITPLNSPNTHCHQPYKCFQPVWNKCFWSASILMRSSTALSALCCRAHLTDLTVVVINSDSNDINNTWQSQFFGEGWSDLVLVKLSTCRGSCWGSLFAGADRRSVFAR